MGKIFTMNIIDRLKNVFGIKKSLTIDELNKVPLMTEKWIFCDYIVPIPDSKLLDLRKSVSQDLNEPVKDLSKIDLVVAVVTPYSVFPNKAIACLPFLPTNIAQDPMFSFIGSTPTVSVLLQDIEDSDYEIETLSIRDAKWVNEEKYLISPVYLLSYRNVFLMMERVLIDTFDLKRFLNTQDFLPQ